MAIRPNPRASSKPEHSRKRHGKAKIVATLGPATTTPERIKALFEAGVDVFRFNLSHGSHDEHRARYDIVRAIEAESGRPLGVIVDLQGPKLRVGHFRGGAVELAPGDRFRLDLSPEPGDNRRVQLPHAEVLSALARGTNLLLDDGRLRLRIEDCHPDHCDATVLTGGRLSDRKGVNVPDVVLPVSPLTDKDRRDLQFGLELGCDWIALSFVQRPEDIAEARRLIEKRTALMVKLEKPAAIERLDELIEAADGFMVARGDLGVELPPENVPSLQKRIINACRNAGKPVIVATQMLESMVSLPVPTRAEASDVATAVYDGADAVMLSAETASGKYPIEAVAMMNRIILKVEEDPLYLSFLHAHRIEPEHTAADAITAAAAQVAHTLGVAAIVTYTTSGSTALRAARERPGVPILCLTAQLETARRLAVVWGTHCVRTEDVTNLFEMTDRACNLAKDEGMAESGQRLVITVGLPFGTPGATNALRIAWVE
jgi:pyruvate kinase